MRKLLSLLLVGLILIGGVSSAFAQTNIDNVNTFDERAFLEEDREINPRYLALKEFTEEFHMINDLLIEGHTLKINLIEQKDLILDLYIEAVENGNFETLKEARVIRDEIRNANEEIVALREEINDLTETKIILYDSIIEILS